MAFTVVAEMCEKKFYRDHKLHRKSNNFINKLLTCKNFTIYNLFTYYFFIVVLTPIITLYRIYFVFKANCYVIIQQVIQLENTNKITVYRKSFYFAMQ